MRASILLVGLLTIFTITTYLFMTCPSPILWQQHHYLPLQPATQSQILHINGSQKYLGEARPIYIINLPFRSDRRMNSIALMQTFDFDAFIVPAYSPHSPEIIARNYNRYNLFLKSTELACWASHTRVWMGIVANSLASFSENNDAWSFILEDDIDLELLTPEVMQSFPRSMWNEADLIYIGHCGNPPGHLMYKSSKHEYRVHIAHNPSCTHAYAIRSSTAQKLIDLLSKPLESVDNSITNLVRDNQILAYSIHPPLAIQNPVSSVNPSNVNLSNRQSVLFRLPKWIDSWLQWWDGVQVFDRLNASALQQANFTRAKYWRKLHERDIWIDTVK